MGNLAGFLAGVIIGVILCVAAQNRLDDSHVEAGVMEHRGSVYIIRKAKILEPTP